MSINKQLIKGRVRELIDNDQLRQAIDYLIKYLDAEYDQQRNEASILRSQILDVEKTLSLNRMTYEEARIVKNKIASAILQLACDICDHEST